MLRWRYLTRDSGGRYRTSVVESRSSSSLSKVQNMIEKQLSRIGYPYFLFLQLSIVYAETVLEISENPGMLVRDHFVPCIIVIDWLRDCKICSLNSEKKVDVREIGLKSSTLEKFIKSYLNCISSSSRPHPQNKFDIPLTLI